MDFRSSDTFKNQMEIQNEHKGFIAGCFSSFLEDKMKTVKMLTLLCLFIFLMFPILQCKAQTTNPKITQEQYQWNDDMKRLKITTPEKGLIFKITISNEGNTPVEIDKLYINVRVESSNRQYWSFFKQLTIDYLYLPKNEDDYRFVEVDFGGAQIIGSYTAKLTYSIGYVSGEGTPIEIYPFDFQVMSEEQFQKTINQNPSAPIINIYIPVTVTVVGTGGVTLIMWELLRRRRRGRR